MSIYKVNDGRMWERNIRKIKLMMEECEREILGRS